MLLNPKEINSWKAMDPMSIEVDAPASLVMLPYTRNVRKAFPELDKDRVICFMSPGQWAPHELAIYLAESFGPCRLSILTWSISPKAVDAIHAAKKQGLFTYVEALLDYRTSIRNTASDYSARQAFDRIAYRRSHAKVACLNGEGWGALLTTSANFSPAPRIECGTLITSQQPAMDFARWLNNSIFNTNL